jgi:hypothetical protein
MVVSSSNKLIPAEMLGFFMQGSPARFFTDYPTLLAKRASNLFPSPFPIVGKGM